MTEPLRMSFDVACSAGHAFTVWTSGIGIWWPPTALNFRDFCSWMSDSRRCVAGLSRCRP